MKLFSAVAKELLEISHDRTMLAVLIIFPIFIMLFMGVSFRSMEINGLPIGVVGPQNSTFSAMLLSGLNESKAFNLHSYDYESYAMADFRDGKLKALIIVPPDFEDTLGRGSGSKIRIIVDNSDLALEQSVISAMSAVVQASSADITKSYVKGAWDQLGELNNSASSLAGDVAASRDKMGQTKARLNAIKQDLSGLNISRLEASLESASEASAALSAGLEAQRTALQNASEQNSAFMNQTGAMLANASDALNQSIYAVQDTHDRLVVQEAGLTQTAGDIQDAIDGLSLIRNSTNDSAAAAALDLNIMSLRSMLDSTKSQIAAAQNETVQLEDLNRTLVDFNTTLAGYSSILSEARSRNDMQVMEDAIDLASDRITALDSTFMSARSDVAQLRKVMEGMDSALADIDSTLDQALAQTGSVDSLISKLQGTVAEQTSRDPGMIAAPLSIDENKQYEGASYVDFLMPQIIAVSLLFSCFLLASISLVREKTGNTIVRALMSPMGMLNLVLGKVVTMVLLSMAQVLLILVVAFAVFGVKAPSDIGMLVAGTVVSSLVLSSIGIAIGFYARSESAAIQTCLLIAIPMLFLGNIIFSPDLLPAFTQILQQLLPLAHVTNIYKIVLITNGNPVGDMLALGTYFVLLAIVLTAIMVKRKDIANFQ